MVLLDFYIRIQILTFTIYRANCSLAGYQDEEHIYKPDFLLSAKPWAQVHNLVAAEVKPPGKTINGDIIDFSKLGIEMKIMLDFIIKNNPNIVNPEVFGVLVEGKFKLQALVPSNTDKRCNRYDVQTL